MTHVYAQHGSPEFNDKLGAALCDLAGDVRDLLGSRLIALVLGGGYGRGEGGVVAGPHGERPYNDLDLTIIVQGRRRGLLGELAEVGEKYEELLGIDVDFSRPLRLRDVQHWPHRLMWQDLLNGHIVLVGPENIIRKYAPARLAEALPTIEATHLLLNRGAGLLWAMICMDGQQAPPDEDFIRRNYYKAALAMGDAVSIAHQRYDSSLVRRGEALRELAYAVPAVAQLDLDALYNQALTFKLWPDKVPTGAIARDELREITRRWGQVFLHVERHRAGKHWPSLARYASWPGRREKAQNNPLRWGHNFTHNLALHRLSVRYPRERLYRQLPDLLGLTGKSSGHWRQRAGEFLAVWKKFN